MSGPQRKPDQTAISVSMSRELLSQIDARAARLGLNRSTYLASLVRNDLVEKGALVLQEKPAPANSTVEAAKKIVAVVDYHARNSRKAAK